ncbi:transcription antitermination protein NusG [Rhodonellum psychrophilum GCM71 = DSM 17998]|jgi:transcriptional antiterminator NusG|uniref:Transcription termination/antitermination protein NusG n=2 Tax=Rhodonellum TaxID=336827 RepID=U5C7L0_9BACT|nr:MULTISPECIES: transcription termination/antitermination protein NusG [Rhodonellum]ERM84936.1 transcription antitermination protein NusG [Rhodonellum psychrophilum GCM71 = DSM 17998]MDO9551996.1 transcription termination/antitermination protein NusG [Rhodonellum sp.]SDY74186.1 transcription antitermination protein nusG [Rhodonellum ikkaensis]
MTEHKWYVLRVVAGQEKKAKTYLDNEILRQKLEDYIPEVLIPSEKVYEMRNGKKRVRERNFFPGYVLVNADLSHGEANHVITSIPGVIGFLGSNKGGASKTPEPLRQSEINRILGRVEEIDEFTEKLDTPFIIGETVKVMDGPFSGFAGTIEEVFEDKKKLNVMVKIFGRNTPVELNFIQVEKQD